MDWDNLLTTENIGEICEYLTQDEAKDLLAMNYKKHDSDLHAISSTVPTVVEPSFAPEELQEKSNISSLKTRIESLEKAVYLLIRNNMD